MAGIEPLNLALNRADTAGQIQNLFHQADKAAKAGAAKTSLEAGRQETLAVVGPEALEGNTIREEADGGNGGEAGGNAERKPGEEEAKDAGLPKDADGKGRKLDIKA